MSRSRSAVATAVLVTAIAGALLVVGVAGAAKLSGESETATLPNDDDTHRLDVTCPEGSTATGGGIRLRDDLNDFVQGTYPYIDGWRVAAYRRSSSTGPSTFTAYVRCIKSKKVANISEKIGLTDPSALDTVFAKCPKGTWISGGGGQLGDDVNDYLSGSYPYSNRQWLALGRGSATLASDALCTEGAKPKIRTKSFEMPGDDDTHEVTAKCPRGTVSTGGGGRLSDPVGNYFQGSYPTGKRKWTAAGFDTGTLTAYVVCRKQ